MTQSSKDMNKEYIKVINEVSSMTPEAKDALVLASLKIDVFVGMKAGSYNGTEFAQQIQYQGFDQETIISRIMQIPMDTNGDYKDIYMMVKIYIERGNNIDAMIKKASTSESTRFF